MSAAIVMYHRVCMPGPRTACYFARGTAVSPTTFERHLGELERRFRFVTLTEALAGNSIDPVCALTFDDGYRDVVDTVLPQCAKRGIPIAVFPIADYSGDAATATWFDTYYDLLHRATRRSAINAGSLGLAVEQPVPPIDNDLRWWVRGPVKQLLAALPREALDGALVHLAAVLAVPAESARTAQLYLRHHELAMLQRGGVAIGGHGATHRRLDALPLEAARAELEASVRLLDSVSAPCPRIFCYPDGGRPQNALSLLEPSGFAFGLTVEPGPWDAHGDRTRVPRYLLRDTTTSAEFDGMLASTRRAQGPS